jgi:1-deoxy-D-xylulose-5-phosphate reductoisomerase
MSSRSPADLPPASPGDRPRVRVALLGSTGSIGRQAVDVLERHADRFDVVALATGRNAAELSAQAARLHPAVVSLAGSGAPMDLPTSTARIGGDDALEALATRDDVDLVLVGTGGVV